MEWKDIFGKILDPALEVVKAFVPGSGLAIQGVKAIASVFGLKEDEVTPEKLQELAAQDKDFALKMMQANQLFQISIMKEETERMKLELADVQNARTREVSLKDNVNKILAYSIVGAFIALVGATLLGYAKVESALAGTLVGYLSAKCEQILAYYFGSSKSSDHKTELLAKAEPIK